jgi:hypothetical protein
MGWEGTDNEAVYPTPEPIDPFPFTPEGRLYARLEHELKAAEAALRVGALVLEKSAIQAKRSLALARRRRRLGVA